MTGDNVWLWIVYAGVAPVMGRIYWLWYLRWLKKEKGLGHRLDIFDRLTALLAMVIWPLGLGVGAVIGLVMLVTMPPVIPALKARQARLVAERAAALPTADPERVTALEAELGSSADDLDEKLKAAGVRLDTD